MKLTEAGRRLLSSIPDDWSSVPIFGDTRPRRPLIRSGLVEVREIDTTPPEMGNSPVRFVDQQWRRTEAGRAALEDGR